MRCHICTISFFLLAVFFTFFFPRPLLASPLSSCHALSLTFCAPWFLKCPYEKIEDIMSTLNCFVNENWEISRHTHTHEQRQMHLKLRDWQSWTTVLYRLCMCVSDSVCLMVIMHIIIRVLLFNFLVVTSCQSKQWPVTLELGPHH